MNMSKRAIICKEYLSEVCDIIGGEMDDRAEKIFTKDIEKPIADVVKTTTKNYKELLLRLIFEDEKGEQDG